MGRFLRDLTFALVAAGGVVWGVERWVALPFVVEGPSMEPTLRDGERVIVALRGVGHRSHPIGEIVLIAGPADEALVKRIANVPGGAAAPPPRLPAESPLERSYYVLGDNSTRSSDSRDFGPVPESRIRGRVIWRYWPLSRLGSIE